MKLKTLLAISALCVPSFVVFTPEKAKALPFQENCASMQAYANALRFSNPTQFSGFENASYIPYGLIMCKTGYVKETSPMGTRVCSAQLQYDKQGMMNAVMGLSTQPGITWVPFSCRWM